MQETIDKIQSDLSYSKNLLSAWVDRAGQVLDQQIPNPGTLSLDTIEQELNQLENEVQVARRTLTERIYSGTTSRTPIRTSKRNCRSRAKDHC